LIRESGKQLNNNIDKTIVWIISLAAGAIVLILSNLDKINFVPTAIVKYVIVFLSISVITGILGRISLIVSVGIENHFSDMYNLELSLLEIPYKPSTIRGNETAEVIHQMMILDFNEDFPYFVQAKTRIPIEGHPDIDKKARQFYEDYSKEAKKDIDNSMIDLQKVFIKSFGYKDDYLINEKASNNRGKRKIMQATNFCSYLFSTVSALSFILSVVILIKAYVFN
jgi:hypothetical protein